MDMNNNVRWGWLKFMYVYTIVGAGGPWTCVFSEQYETRSAAMNREQEIKAKKSKKYIEFLIADRQSPESFRD